MLNPRLQRYADRFREVIAEGEVVANSCLYDDTYSGGDVFIVSDPKAHYAWIAKSRNIINIVFSDTSSHAKQYENTVVSSNASLQSNVYAGVGCLTAALSDLESGFVKGQEIAIASEVFDSVLQQAKYLNDHGFKDPAAVLTRVVIEDALKRMANEESVDSTLKATRLNDELKKANRYTQPQWRQIQAWLDIGNSAAHGDFHEYTKDEVSSAISGVETFLATYFV